MLQASVVADLFHVLKQVNQELDAARKNCRRTLKNKKDTPKNVEKKQR